MAKPIDRPVDAYPASEVATWTVADAERHGAVDRYLGRDADPGRWDHSREMAAAYHVGYRRAARG